MHTYQLVILGVLLGIGSLCSGLLLMALWMWIASRLRLRERLQIVPGVILCAFWGPFCYQVWIWVMESCSGS